VVGEARPAALELVISNPPLGVEVPALPAVATVVGEARPATLELVISDLGSDVEVAVPSSALTTPVLTLVFGVVENIAVTPALETSSLESSTEVLVFENNVLVICGCINPVDVIKAAPSAPTFEVENGDYLLLRHGFDDTTESDEEGQKGALFLLPR
jgi:hypothetical protein